jgi:hypothetical protein
VEKGEKIELDRERGDKEKGGAEIYFFRTYFIK